MLGLNYIWSLRPNYLGTYLRHYDNEIEEFSKYGQGAYFCIATPKHSLAFPRKRHENYALDILSIYPILLEYHIWLLLFIYLLEKQQIFFNFSYQSWVERTQNKLYLWKVMCYLIHKSTYVLDASQVYPLKNNKSVIWGVFKTFFCSESRRETFLNCVRHFVIATRTIYRARIWNRQRMARPVYTDTFFKQCLRFTRVQTSSCR